MTVDRVIAPTRDDPDLRVGNEFLGGPAGAHRAPPGFWTPVRVVLLVGTVVYWLGFLRTSPCMSNGWLDPDRYEALCYSDIPVLYGLRGIAEGLLPIVDWPPSGQPLEYPALTAVWVWLLNKVSALVGGTALANYAVTAVGAFAFFLAALAATARTVAGRPWDGMLLAASPAVFLASFINWDWAAVSLTALALLAWSRRHPVAAGVAIGLGASFKFYPVLVLGALALLCWRARRLPAFGAAAAATAAAWLIVNVPFMVANFEGWAYFYRFSAERGRDFGSVWLAAETAGLGWDTDAVNAAAGVLFLTLCAAIAALALFAPRKPRLAQVSLLLVAAFALSGKVYSPQFVLWLLPLAVLARPRWRDLIWWQAAQAVYFVAIWWHLVGLSGGERGLDATSYALAILVHVGGTIWFCGLVVRDILWPRFDPVRSDADPAHIDDPGGGVLDRPGEPAARAPAGSR